MSILVCNVDGAWREWRGDAEIQQMVSTFVAQYADGRSTETPCDPYPISVRLNGDNVVRFYDQGIWSLEEVQAVGGALAEPFQVPEGKQTVGAPTYVVADGTVKQVYEIEDIPPPPLPLTVEEKFARLLNDYGLTKAELQEMLA